jgi:hypothetical protein
MVGIPGHQNLGDSGFGRQTALDRSAAQAPGFARHGPRKSGRHIWAELRPHHIQPFTPVLADQLQLALAARTGLVVDVDDDLNPRQMRRQRSPVDTALVSSRLSIGERRTIGLRSTVGLGLLDVFKAQASGPRAAFPLCGRSGAAAVPR